MHDALQTPSDNTILRKINILWDKNMTRCRTEISVVQFIGESHIDPVLQNHISVFGLHYNECH